MMVKHRIMARAICSCRTSTSVQTLEKVFIEVYHAMQVFGECLQTNSRYLFLQMHSVSEFWRFCQDCSQRDDVKTLQT